MEAEGGRMGTSDTQGQRIVWLIEQLESLAMTIDPLTI